MKTISFTIELTDEQHDAIDFLAKREGYTDATEFLVDRVKNHARSATREAADVKSWSSKPIDVNNGVEVLAKSVELQTQTISRLVNTFVGLQHGGVGQTPAKKPEETSYPKAIEG